MRRGGRSRGTQTGKLLVPLLGVLAALAMGVAAVAIVLQIQEREKRVARERELQLALAENDDLKVRLEEAQEHRSRAEDQLAGARKELAQAREELEQAVTAQEALSRSIEDREKEIARLTKDLEQASAESKRMADELKTDRQKLADLEQAREELEAKVMELSGQPTVELDKVLVTGEPAGAGPAAGTGLVMPVSTAVPPVSDGQVVVINREFDFIVMNLGRNHGLSVGQEFQIVRGNEVLGRVKVEKVYDELSAAALLPDARKDSIREGDVVKAL